MTKQSARSTDPQTILAKAKEHDRKKRHRKRPCGAGPAIPTNVLLVFDTVDKARHDRIRGISQCSEITLDANGGEAEAHHYVFNLQSSTDGITPDSRIRRAMVKAKDDDANTTVEKVWHAGIRKWRYYRTRVKAVDSTGCSDGFSAWTAFARPADDTAPPVPINVTFDVDQHALIGKWDVPSEVADSVIPDEAVAFAHAQVATDSGFTNIIRSGRFTFEHARWKISKPSGNYWFRVQNVDSSRNKSAYVTVGPITKKTPTTPVISSITFDMNGTRHARYRALVAVTVNDSSDDAVGDRVIVQFCHKDTNVTPTASDRKHREILDADVDGTDDLIAVFRNIRKNHYTFARARKWDTQGRKSAWTAWTSGGKPSGTQAPTAVASVTVDTSVAQRVEASWPLLDAEDEDVGYYKVEFYKGAVLKKTKHVGAKQDHAVYRVPQGDEGATHTAKVYAIADQGSTAAAATSATTTPRLVGQADVSPDSLRYDRFKISGAKAHGNSNQSLTSGTEATLGLNTITIDTNSAVDTANDRIELKWWDANRKGVYLIFAHAQFAANATGRRVLRIERKDGTGAFAPMDLNCNIQAAPTGATDCIIAEMANLTIDVGGTWIRARVEQNSGGNLDVNAGVFTKNLGVLYQGTADTL